MSNETVVKHAQPELLALITVSIDKLAASERVTKAELSFLSRSTLEYLVLNSSTDIDCVNRILTVCTPMNKATAALFFDHFLPWKYDDATKQFTNMIKGDKAKAKYLAKVQEFMANDANDIWTWAEVNVDIAPKAKDYHGLISKLVTKAMAETQKNGSIALTHAEVLKAVMVGGINANDLMEVADEVTTTPPEEVPGAEVIANATPEAEAAVH